MLEILNNNEDIDSIIKLDNKNYLTKNMVSELIINKNNLLKSIGLIEINNNVLKLIIKYFSLSSYIDKYNYNEIINVLSDKELEIIKLKLLYLLKYKINKYNNNLVSSISYNEAVNINNSNYYVIKLYLSNKTTNEQRDILLNNDIIDIYNKSNDNIIRLFNKTKLFYNTIFKNNIINTKNYYYNSTLYEGIDVFFKKYNYSYDSTNYVITVDYNTYILRSNYLGIEFINDYLIKMNYENIFCNKFNNIDNLLIKLYSNYIDLPINIFEIVLTKVIILECLNKNIYKLDSNIEVNILYNDYKNIDNYILKLNKCYDKVINNLKLNKDTYNYLLLCKKDIINNIVFHTKNNTLDMIC